MLWGPPPCPTAAAAAAALLAVPTLPHTSCPFLPLLQLAQWVAPYTGLSQAGTGLALVLLLLIAMGPVCERLGGGQPALYNPANNAFVWATGSGTAWEHLVRAVSGAAGCTRCGRSTPIRPAAAAEGRSRAAAVHVCRAPCGATHPRPLLALLQVAQACGAVGGVLLARALLPPAWTK